MTIPDAGPAIVAFGLSRGGMGHGVLGIARSAGRLGIRVHHVHRGPRPVSRTSRYNAGACVFPSGVDPEHCLPALLSFGERLGAPLLVAVDDESAMFVDDHADALSTAFRFPRQPPGLVRSLASKREMHGLCLRHGIPTPRATFPSSEAELLDDAASLAYPVVAKRIDASVPAPPRAPSVVIAEDARALLDAVRRMSLDGTANVMLQEHVPAGPAVNWMFNGYFDGSSTCLFSYTALKLRQAPPYTGATTLGRLTPNPVVTRTTTEFMKALGYQGILDIGFRYDSRDGAYKLLDANPRIGATFRLFVDPSGGDVLRAQYDDLTGRPVRPAGEADGRRWIVESQDLKSSRSYRRDGQLGVRSWLRSLRGVEEAAWWARDDLVPFAMVVPCTLAARLRRTAASGRIARASRAATAAGVAQR